LSPIVERLAVLRQQLDHLRSLRPRLSGVQSLKDDLSLRNDILYALVAICQVVIDVASEFSARRGERFEDYTEAVRNLVHDRRFAPELVEKLVALPGFRNVLVHEYVSIDLNRVVAALDQLDVLEQFLQSASAVADEDMR